MSRVARQIVELVGIALDIEEQLGLAIAMDVFVAALAQHQRRLRQPLEEELARRHIRPTLAAAGKEGRQAAPVEGLDRVEGTAFAGQIEDRRQQIDERDIFSDSPPAFGVGRRDDQRDARRPLIGRHLVPEPALAQHVAVIGTEDDRGVVELADIAERVEDAADEIVDQADIGVIGMARGADMRLGHLIFGAIVVAVEPGAIGIALLRARSRARPADRCCRDRSGPNSAAA